MSGRLADGVRLLETMRASAGVAGVASLALWSRHRARLAASARDVGVALDLDAVEAALARALEVSETDRRVRLTVGSRGDVQVETGAVAPPPSVVWLDPEPFAEAGGRYCIHKTTSRSHYDRRLARARDNGADDAVLFDASGRLVESARASVWVERGTRLLTPPLTAGGLPGVMRAHLLATRAATAEATLTRDDVAAADAVWLSNAVVGLVRVSVLLPR